MSVPEAQKVNSGFPASILGVGFVGGVSGGSLGEPVSSSTDSFCVPCEVGGLFYLTIPGKKMIAATIANTATMTIPPIISPREYSFLGSSFCPSGCG